MKNRVLILLMLCFSTYTPAEGADRPTLPTQSEASLHSTAPSRAEWQGFQRLSFARRLALWKNARQQGLRLKDWHWQWRMAWIKHCSKKKSKACENMLLEGLQDRAALIRGHTAKIIGRLYAGSHDSSMTTALVEAGNNPKNFRNQKPLGVQRHIIFALNRVGLAEGRGMAKSLAGRHPTTLAYWHRLERVYADKKTQQSKKQKAL